jgi:hypothetical protein
LRRPIIVGALVALLVPLLGGSVATAQTSTDVAFNFNAALSGEEETPPVETDGTGVASLSINESETELTFQIVTYDLEEILFAHIHCGAEGVAGPVGITLYGGPTVTQDGILVQGTATEPDEANACLWVDLDDAIQAMRAEEAYVNVHTVENGGGEIRGQTVPLVRPAEPEGSFTDDDGNVHEGQIEVIASAGITRGCNPPDNDEYCPSDSITRGQMAAFFNRGFNLLPEAEDRFTDDEASEFEGDINAVAAVDITRGCNPPDNDEFCPDSDITRGQMAAFIVRALALPASTDDHFVDDETSEFEGDINALAEAGIAVGCNPPDNDEFCPDDPVQRDQMASFLARAFLWRAHATSPSS